MRSNVLERKLHLIVEGEMDARILCTLLTHEKYTSVHYTATNGYHNMSSIVSTLRLMLEPEDKMLVVFDSDTENPTDIEDKITTMSYLTKADVSRVKIGIFALVPDIERALFCMSKQELKKKRLNVARLLKENFEEIKNKDAIKRMQAFIDE